MTTRARRGYDHAIGLLEKLVPLARVLRGAMLAYALMVVASVAVIAGVLLWSDAPSVWFTWLGFVLLIGALLIAPGLLLIFVWMLREVLELPAKLRALPDVGPAHAVELAKLVNEARQGPDPGAPRERPRSMPRDMWRAGRMVMQMRDDIPLPGPVLAIVRVPLLIAVGVAFGVGAFEVLMAAVAVTAAVVATVVG